MLAIGVLLLGLAVCAVLVLRTAFTRPDAPRWTQIDLVGELTAVAITAMFGFGLISTGMGLIDLVDGDVTPAQILPAILALLITVAAVWFVQSKPRMPRTVRPAH